MNVKELIGVAVLIAGIFGGTVMADRILQETRKAALTKAAQGLPPLSAFAAGLTRAPQPHKNSKGGNK